MPAEHVDRASVAVVGKGHLNLSEPAEAALNLDRLALELRVALVE